MVQQRQGLGLVIEADTKAALDVADAGLGETVHFRRRFVQGPRIGRWLGEPGVVRPRLAAWGRSSRGGALTDAERDPDSRHACTGP